MFDILNYDGELDKGMLIVGFYYALVPTQNNFFKLILNNIRCNTKYSYLEQQSDESYEKNGV